MGGRHSELCHDGSIQRDAANMKLVRVFLHPLQGTDMLLQQILELKGIIVLRDFYGQAVGGGLGPNDNQQEVIKHGHDEIVCVGKGMQQFLFYLPEQAHILCQFLGRGI